MRIMNRSMEIALTTLGYSPEEREEIMHYRLGPPDAQRRTQHQFEKLRLLGASEEDVDALRKLSADGIQLA